MNPKSSFHSINCKCALVVQELNVEFREYSEQSKMGRRVWRAANYKGDDPSPPYEQSPNEKQSLNNGSSSNNEASSIIKDSSALPLASPPNSIPDRSQCNWRLCKKCLSLQHAGALCPASGVHDFSESENYALAHGMYESSRGEGGWNWCNKCQLLSFTGVTNGPCSAGHVHDTTGSGAYSLPFEPQNFSFMGRPGRRSWRRCQKCQGVVYSGGFGGGPCEGEGGGEHVYAPNAPMPYIISTDHFPNVRGPVQDQWRRCGKCNLLAFDGHSFCSGGGTHISVDSENFFLGLEPPNDAEGAYTQRAFRTCTKCNCLIHTQASEGQRPCANGGDHNPDFRKSFRVHTQQRGSTSAAWRACGLCDVVYQPRGNSKCANGPAGTNHQPREGMEEFWIEFSEEDGRLQCSWETDFGVCLDHAQRSS